MSRLIKSSNHDGAVKEKVIEIRMIGSSVSGEQQVLLQTASADAEKMIQSASRKAEEILFQAAKHEETIKAQIIAEQQNWEAEKSRLIEEAYEEGMKQGLQQGRKKGREEYSDQIAFAQGIIASAERDYHQKLEAAEPVILDLGLKVAEKIIGESVSGKSEEFLPLVKRALKNARGNKEVELHVHPVHYDFLLSHAAELEAVFPRDCLLFIYPEDELSETSCIIETGNGRIDASVDSQLEEIKQRLYEMLESEQ
ncbi:flagellar assembly protein FliH [Mesobacillus foraminis]|uniref:Flagellar assembly protein FliH n=1 Tax=Mesobacillus foraminis TaxID=279826 RepID=A0A4R2BF75_9BACI|nr:flagellar assembly protein FliH [Mesobacillus foraminis]TCN25621.1 flagellar assembly protein FliH [Mesobacillus foraminis]